MENKFSDITNSDKLDEQFHNFSLNDIGDAFKDAGKSIGAVGQDAIDAAKRAKEKADKLVRDAAASAKALKEKGDAKLKKDLAKIKEAKDKQDAKVKAALKGAGKTIAKAKKKMDDRVKADLKKVLSKLDKGQLMHTFNITNPATVTIRGVVISMLQSNLLGLATGFGYMKDKNSPEWEKIKDKWWLMGGDKNKLNSNVDRGKKKKELLKKEILKLMPKKHGFDGEYSNADAGSGNVGTAVAVAASLLGVATPILASIVPAGEAPAVWTGIGAGFLGAVSPMMKKFGQDNGADPNALAEIPPPPTAPFPPEPTDADLDRIKLDANGKPMLDANGYPIMEGDDILGMSKPVFYTGLAIVGIAATLLVLKLTGVIGKK